MARPLEDPSTKPGHARLFIPSAHVGPNRRPSPPQGPPRPPAASTSASTVRLPLVVPRPRMLASPAPRAPAHVTRRSAIASGVDIGTDRTRALARRACVALPRAAPVVRRRTRSAVDRGWAESALGLLVQVAPVPEHAGRAGPAAGKPLQFVPGDIEALHAQLQLGGNPPIMCPRAADRSRECERPVREGVWSCQSGGHRRRW